MPDYFFAMLNIFMIQITLDISRVQLDTTLFQILKTFSEVCLQSSFVNASLFQNISYKCNFLKLRVFFIYKIYFF